MLELGLEKEIVIIHVDTGRNERGQACASACCSLASRRSRSAPSFSLSLSPFLSSLFLSLFNVTVLAVSYLL